MSSPVAPMPPPPPAEAGPRRLTRSRQDRVIGGVAGGLGRHLGIDPVLLRIAFVVLALAGGGGVLAYLVAWLVIPEEPFDTDGSGGASTAPGDTASVGAGGITSAMFGAVLIGVGGFLLLDRLVDVSLWRYLAPALLIGLGVVLVARRGGPS
jgi:phage shock protein C